MHRTILQSIAALKKRSNHYLRKINSKNPNRKISRTMSIHLEEKVLAVIICESLRRLNNLMQIGIHEFINQIDILEVSPMTRHHYVFQCDHIFMLKMPKKLQFSQSSQSVNTVLKCIVYLFYCNFLIGFPVHRRAHNTICPSTNRFDGHIFCINLKQGLPHGIIMFPWGPDPIRRLHWSCHFLQIIEQGKIEEFSREQGLKLY